MRQRNAETVLWMLTNKIRIRDIDNTKLNKVRVITKIIKVHHSRRVYVSIDPDREVPQPL